MSEVVKGLPKFEGEDFGVWKAVVLAYLVSKDRDYLLTEETPKLYAATSTRASEDDKKKRCEEHEKFKKEDREVKALLLLSLDKRYVRQVLGLETSKQVWNRLLALHEQTSAAMKVIKQKEFSTLRMKKDEQVADYVSRGESLANQLSDMGRLIDEETLVSTIVAGLPSPYQNFISNWSNQDPTKQTLDNLIARLSAEELLVNRFKKQNNRKQENAHVSSTSTNNNKNSKKNSSKKRNKKKGCFICHDENHTITQCSRYDPDYKKKQQAKSNDSDKKESKRDDKKREEEENIVAEEANLSNESSSSNIWIVDTGASCHMTSDREDFIEYEKLKTPRLIRFGGSQVANGVGVGTVVLRTSYGDKEVKFNLRNVLHVPKIRRKLISVSAATRAGCTGEITEDRIILTSMKGNKLIARLVNNLYVLNEETQHRDVSSKVSSDDESNLAEIDLWHQRMGHINKKYLIESSKVVRGMDSLVNLKLPKPTVHESIDCYGCCQGKMPKKHIPSRTSPRATEVGQRVHMDIGGPVGTKGLQGGSYYILFKDEFSNYRSVFILKNRSEAFDCIRQVVANTAAESGKRVRMLVSDCGSEFTSLRSKEFLLEKEIVHVKSAPFFPATNGFIERENRVLMNGVRSILFGRNIPEHFWDEAAKTMVYLLNRTVSGNKSQTAFELYFGLEPQVSHIRVFGCTGMYKTLTKKRSGYQKKVEERARKCILIGYEGDYTYRVFDVQTKKIVITKDVVFDELAGQTELVSYPNLDRIIDGLEKSSDAPEEGSTLSDEEDDDEVNIGESDPGVPRTYNEAIKHPYADEWQKAMDLEYDSLIKRKTWTLVGLPEGRKPITGKWVYAIKYKDGEVDRFKARYVARGFSQVEGIDFVETFSPVVKMDTIRILLVLANQFDWMVKQIDISTAFLYGSLKEEIYITQPKGYERDNRYCKLKKAIYGLKQASLCWNRCFTDFLKKFELRPLKSDACVFLKGELGNSDPILIVAIYVDDGLVMSNKQELLDACIEHLKQKFEVKVEKPTTFLGIKIEQTDDGILLHQHHYINKMVKKYGLEDSKEQHIPMPSSVKVCKKGCNNVESVRVNVQYRQLIGSLLYAALATRPDISFSLNVLSRYSEEPRKVHWVMLKNILRYLKATSTHGLKCMKSDEVSLECFSDADFGGCLDTRRSTTGYVIFLNKTPIIWKSTRQSIASTSTCEAEFIAASTAAKELMWSRNILEEIGLQFPPSPLFVDNQGTIKLIQNDQVHAKTKHLDIKLHFIRDINNKLIELKYVASEDNIADGLTKALDSNKFNKFIDLLNLRGDEHALLAEMQGPTAILLLAAMVGATQGFLLGPKYSVQEHEVMLSYSNPCEFMLDDSMKTEIAKLQQSIGQVKNDQPNHCRSEKMYQFEFCIEKSRYVTNILTMLPTVSIRFKRSLIMDIYEDAIKLPGIILAAATNWIKAVSKTCLQDVVETLSQELMSSLTIAGTRDFSNLSIVPYDHAKEEISRLSLFVAKDPTILNQAIMSNRDMHSFLDYVNDKFILAEILLSNIYRMLKQSKLDTQSLGELTNNPSLMKIDPESTKVKSVTEEQMIHAIKFIFEVQQELPLSQRINLTNVILIIIGTIIIALLSFLSVSSLRKRNDPAEVSTNANQVLYNRLSERFSRVRTSMPAQNTFISGTPNGYEESERVDACEMRDITSRGDIGAGSSAVYSP